MARPHPWEAHYPAELDWGAALPERTLPELLDGVVRRFAAAPALEYRGAVISYAELGAQVERVARGLAALGIGAGDAVGLLLPNTPVHPITFFAATRLGARIVHLTPLDPPRAIVRKLADSGARTLVSTDLPGLLQLAVGVRDAGGCDRLIMAADGAWGSGGAGLGVPAGAVDWGALDGPALPAATVRPSDVAVLQYTGGTTGVPRAAMLTHANLTSAVEIYARWTRAAGQNSGPGDRVVCVLPLFHIYALTAVMLRALESGALLLLRVRFDAEVALADIEAGATHFPGVPTMWIALVNHPRIGSADLSSLKVLSSGGAALPGEVSERFTALTSLRIGGGWGMTETSPAGTMLLAGRVPGPGEIGVPLPGIEMDVVAVDDPRRVLAPGEVGELRIRGPNVTIGYWQRPEENEQAFVDGWFLTGDIGTMSADGVFAIVDRKKEMLISGGFNVYPRTIEDAIHEHPDVREAAVIGIDDAYRGQAAKAYVTLKPGASMTLEGLRTFLADRLGRHELPTALEVRDELPHTAVGKLAKRELIEEMRAEGRSHG